MLILKVDPHCHMGVSESRAVKQVLVPKPCSMLNQSGQFLIHKLSLVAQPVTASRMPDNIALFPTVANARTPVQQLCLICLALGVPMLSV